MAMTVEQQAEQAAAAAREQAERQVERQFATLAEQLRTDTLMVYDALAAARRERFRLFLQVQERRAVLGRRWLQAWFAATEDWLTLWRTLGRIGIMPRGAVPPGPWVPRVPVGR